MDRVIEKKKWNSKRIMTIAGVVALVALIMASYLSTSGNSKLNVDQQKITISEIKKGSFQQSIPINGVVLPIKTIYLDAIEGGRVEEKYVEDGAMLEVGQPIMKLSNTNLELELANRETGVYDLITNMQRLRTEAEQNSIRLYNQLAEVDNALAEAERVYKANKQLFDEKVIAQQEYQSSKNLYDYQLRRKKLTMQTLRSDSISTIQRLRQMQESINRTQVALGLMRKKADDLTVKAPVAGQLTSLNAEIGESKNAGQRLGQLDVLSGFKVRADIDEHYLSRVFTDLKGTFTFAGKKYELVVKKIYTTVTDGRFQVDMEFIGEVPKGIRRGQTLQILLALSDEIQAVLLPRGGFYQQTGGNWIYKVTKDGESAVKVDIKLGSQNTEYYEVLEGLNVGDKVVTSSYENYGDKDELRIKGGD
jgi:HlyD family secretion protein